MNRIIEARLRETTPSYQMMRFADPRLALYVETMAREAWKIPETFALAGLYVGPRIVWVAFVVDKQSGDGLAKFHFQRGDLDAWAASRGIEVLT